MDHILIYSGSQFFSYSGSQLYGTFRTSRWQIYLMAANELREIVNPLNSQGPLPGPDLYSSLSYLLIFPIIFTVHS